MKWIGIIFLISTIWTSLEPSFDSKGRLTEPLGVQFGINEEYFISEKECWKYLDEHSSFKLLDLVDDRNFYDVQSKIKSYEIEDVGYAYVTCKPKYLSITTPPFGRSQDSTQTPKK